MILSMAIFLPALVACGPDYEPVPLAALDLEDCEGWTGRTPQTKGELLRAASAERAGRLCGNVKLKAAREARSKSLDQS